jgi:hypothetical protein
LHRIATATVARPSHGPWLFAALTATVWFEVLRAAATTSDHTMPPLAAALAGLASQLAFTALEASLAVATWGVMGTRVHWSALAPRLLTVSAAEAFAVAVAAGQPALPPPWPVLLAGSRAGPEGGASGDGGVFLQAFAAFGVLTLVRMALAGFAHARAARVPWARAMLVVVGFYLASRCAMWWTLDLMRGHSFEDPPIP